MEFILRAQKWVKSNKCTISTRTNSLLRGQGGARCFTPILMQAWWFNVCFCTSVFLGKTRTWIDKAFQSPASSLRDALDSSGPVKKFKKVMFLPVYLLNLLCEWSRLALRCTSPSAACLEWSSPCEESPLLKSCIRSAQPGLEQNLLPV